MKALRTLLIDNYDSFTYNLYHLITRVNGIPPVVIAHDDSNWSAERFADFDNIVISPGPGHPGKDSDTGICRDIITHSPIPVLGICLGHQIICLQEGAKIKRAPEARHGRLSTITHSQTELFQNLKTPFQAVRYHSLMAAALPDTVEPTAWSEDGLIMAIRHKHRPLWGLQFHPESIRSEAGEVLLANFASLTRSSLEKRRRAEINRASAPSGAVDEAAKQIRSHRSAALRLLYRKTDWEGPLAAVFDQLFRQSEPSIWLDSARRAYGSGRFSILCNASGQLGRSAAYRVSTQSLTIRQADTVLTKEVDFFDWLDQDIQTHTVEPIAGAPFEFTLGWVGYIGYEMKALTEGTDAHASPYPDATMLFCDRALVYDHEEKTAWLIALSQDQESEKTANAWLNASLSTLHELDTSSLSGPNTAATFTLDSPLALRHDRHAYLRLIERSKEALLDGESYEICLTNMASASCKADPWQLWQALRQHNPAPYAAYLQLEDLAVLSCSPERFLSVSREGIVESKPIKGTAPRSPDPVEDAMLADRLKNSEKEQAENLMIVDLLRNDLGRVAEPDGVSVPQLFEVESYATVHQLVSTVQARLAKNRTACAAVRAAFPGGSMTGAPKKRTLEIIDALEAGPRGIYSGIIGYFSLCGAADFSIVIRTLVMHNDALSLGVGGAITLLSDAEAEFEETRLKAKAFLDLFLADFTDDGASSHACK